MEHSGRSDTIEMAAPWRKANGARFDRLQFRFRLAMVVAIAVACLVVPSVGDRRFLLAALVIGVVLPAHLIVRRIVGVPNPTGWLDLLAVLAAAGIAAIEPAVWAPALLFQMLNVGGAIAYLQAIWVYRLIVASIPAMTAIAIAHRVDGALAMLIIVGVFLPPLLAGTTRKRARQFQASERLHATLASLPIIVWEADAGSGEMISLTGRPEELIGRTHREIERHGFLSHVVDDDLPLLRARFGPNGRQQGQRSIEYRYRRPDGTLTWLRDRITYTETARGTVVRGVTLDVTDARAQEVALERHAQIVEHMSATTITLVPDGDAIRVTRVVDAIEWGLGGALAETVADALPEFMACADIASAIAERCGSRLHARQLTDRFGRERWVELEIFPIPGNGTALIVSDVTAREVAAELVRQQATHDDLTGLANRSALLEHLDELLARDRPVALLLIDLNEFKEVNDTLGHLSGDEYLRTLGRRLGGLASDQRFVARLGGDEFAVVLQDQRQTTIDEAVESIHRACREPVSLFGSAIASGASIGVARAPTDANDAEALLRRADLAMYEAKRRQVVAWYFEPQLERDAGQIKLLGQLGDAFEGGQIGMHFQPIVRLDGEALVGAEALVRWEHPRLGLLPPARFLDLLTVGGRSSDLARVAIEQSADAIRRLPEHLTVSVNLTSQNIRDPRLPALLRNTLAAHDLAPSRFVLEITEQHVLESSGMVRSVVEDLVSTGFAVAIDDFGTGYASLVHLRSLPISQLKLDRQFVASMTRNPDDLAIVRSMIALGHDLGLTITAEGVEDTQTADALRELGCDLAQGYLWARPAPFASSVLAGRISSG